MTLQGRRTAGLKAVGLSDVERLRLRREALAEYAAGVPLSVVLRRTCARARSMVLRDVAYAERSRLALAGTIAARAMLPLRRPRSCRSRCRRVAGRRVASGGTGEADAPARRATAGGLR